MSQELGVFRDEHLMYGNSNSAMKLMWLSSFTESPTVVNEKILELQPSTYHILMQLLSGDEQFHLVTQVKSTIKENLGY